MGATVDDEEVFTNPQDILIDQTNWGTPKSDYGQAVFFKIQSALFEMIFRVIVIMPNKCTLVYSPLLKDQFVKL